MHLQALLRLIVCTVMDAWMPFSAFLRFYQQLKDDRVLSNNSFMIQGPLIQEEEDNNLGLLIQSLSPPPAIL